MNLIKRWLFRLMGVGAATAVAAKLPALPAHARKRVATKPPRSNSNVKRRKYSGYECLDMTNADAITSEFEWKLACWQMKYTA